MNQFEDVKGKRTVPETSAKPSEGQIVLEEVSVKGLDDSSIDLDINACTLRVLFDCIDLDNDGVISPVDMMDSIAQVNGKLMATEAMTIQLHIFLEELMAKYSHREVWTLEDFTNFMHDSAVLGRPAAVDVMPRVSRGHATLKAASTG